jgi:aspartyl-tRNA(Asn)/glutamyl-tRNA(Gln) amidotransferase subunit C
MLLTNEAILRIASLSRIAINEEEFDALRKHLNQILALIEQIKSVNTDHIEPMAYSQNMALRLREDQPATPALREEFLTLAPQTKDGLFLVPKTID